jgi:hypothetical protein
VRLNTGWYEFRLAAGLPSLLPVLGLPAFALLLRLVSYAEGQDAVIYDITRGFEVLLSLAAGLACAHLMTLEHDEGFTELRCSYPEGSWRLPLIRTASALGLLTACILVGGLAFRIGFGDYPFRHTVSPSLAPAVFMVGLSLLASNLSRSYWVSAALVMGWWFLDLQLRGQVTGWLYLFQYTMPHEEVELSLNRLLLAGSGVLFLLFNGTVSSWRRSGKELRRFTLGS